MPQLTPWAVLAMTVIVAVLPSAEAKSAESFAVVELFTSEGCSSCPPADEFLRQLTQQSLSSNPELYPLSFHVDYWNYIGWTDPFSDLRYTQRQYRYARVFGQNTVYTPQMVINGKRGFSGTNFDLAKTTISHELTKTTEAKIDLKVSQSQLGQLVIRYDLDPSARNNFLNFALVERDLSVAVKRGENAQRTLHHDNVVRNFISIPVTKNSGEITMDIPSEVQQKNASLIAYLQDHQTMQINTATRLELESILEYK